jgi:hypothetical protein
MLIAFVALADSLLGREASVAFGPVKEGVDHLEHQRRWARREQREVERLMPGRPIIVEYQHASSELFLNQIQAVKRAQYIGFPGVIAKLDGIA